MASTMHSKIIDEVASDCLQPLGCVRSGKSRTWFDDQGWWLGVVEYQPSGYAKGTYVNVGACFLWNPKDYVSFDYGYRQSGFVEFENNLSFRSQVRHISEVAAEAIMNFRDQLVDFPQTVDTLQSNRQESMWAVFHSGVASGLAGDAMSAYHLFQQVASSKDDSDWAKERASLAMHLRSKLDDIDLFKAHVFDVVNATRQNLRVSGTWNIDHAA